MGRKVKVGRNMGNDSSKREAAFLRAKKKMRKQMDEAWKDFFEKNRDMNEEEVRRRVEERLRRKQK
jgi:hypothetical protein